MISLHLLSGDAAQGLVRLLQPAFESTVGFKLEAAFGAVGAMQQSLLDGAPCDALILTQSLIDDLVQSGQVRAGSARPMGIVKTGLAVKAKMPQPNTATADDLRQALRNASAIYCPDPLRATAGIHFMKVLHELGIAAELADRLRPFPNGVTAMQALADSDDAKAIGWTQVPEILLTPGIDLVADLPPAFELATVYAAAVCTATRHPHVAGQLIAQLVSPVHTGLRRQAGFLPLG